MKTLRRLSAAALSLLIVLGVPGLPAYQAAAAEIEVKAIPLGGGLYHAVLGRGFDYEAYRKGVLADVRDRYYRIPAALPVGRCYFFERYFTR